MVPFFTGVEMAEFWSVSVEMPKTMAFRQLQIFEDCIRSKFKSSAKAD